ncbi:MAG: hypothetical protein ACAI25_11915, partial [Planctomycetota bacterium]
AKAECKKGRGALIARGVEVVEAPEGDSRRSVIERCEQLLGQGRNEGVKLVELSVARDALASRIAQLVEADSVRKSASREHRAAGQAWEGAYSALRAIVEGTLRRTGLRGELLDEVLERYFPSSVERSSTPEKPPVPRPSLPAGPTGTEGTKAA